MLRHEHTSGGERSVMTFRKLEKLIGGGGTAGHRSQPRGGPMHHRHQTKIANLLCKKFNFKCPNTLKYNILVKYKLNAVERRCLFVA